MTLEEAITIFLWLQFDQSTYKAWGHKKVVNDALTVIRDNAQAMLERMQSDGRYLI